MLSKVLNISNIVEKVCENWLCIPALVLEVERASKSTVLISVFDSIKHFNISLTPCGVYEEAREAGEPGWLGTHNGGIGFGEDGEEWDESVNGFGCDFYEECCGEGCVYGEIGQEECF